MDFITQQSADNDKNVTENFFEDTQIPPFFENLQISKAVRSADPLPQKFNGSEGIFRAARALAASRGKRMAQCLHCISMLTV